jgi:predicted DNA-binding transcriptional regulator AlpA
VTTAPLVYDTVGLGQALGLSDRTVRRLDAAGKIPRALRVGGSKRWRLDEIRDWLAAGCPDRARWEQMKKTYLNDRIPTGRRRPSVPSHPAMPRRRGPTYACRTALSRDSVTPRTRQRWADLTAVRLGGARPRLAGRGRTGVWRSHPLVKLPPLGNAVVSIRFNKHDCRAFCQALWTPGDIHEVKILRAYHKPGGLIIPSTSQYPKTLAGWFNDPERVVMECGSCKDVRIYISINPVSKTWFRHHPNLFGDPTRNEHNRP